MAQRQGSGPSPGVVFYTPQAQDDQLLVYLWTEQKWGTAQADRYDDLLVATMLELAANPRKLPVIENLPNVRKYLVRWTNAKDGHYIFYREVAGGIEILRILHSRMDWMKRMGLE